jgi:uncharacterized protein (TIGR03067 family)
MRRIFLLAWGAFLVAASGALSREEAKAPAPKFVGSWVVVSGEKEGEKEPPERIKGTKVRITRDMITVIDNKDKQVYAMKYKVDLEKRPHPITMTVLAGSQKGETAKGIIQLQGEALKLCYASRGGPAPKEFATKKGVHHILFVMKRGK